MGRPETVGSYGAHEKRPRRVRPATRSGRTLYPQNDCFLEGNKSRCPQFYLVDVSGVDLQLARKSLRRTILTRMSCCARASILSAPTRASKTFCTALAYPGENEVSGGAALQRRIKGSRSDSRPPHGRHHSSPTDPQRRSKCAPISEGFSH